MKKPVTNIQTKLIKLFSQNKRIFRVTELVAEFSEQDVASHLSSKVWKISMFVFGSNESFKKDFRYLYFCQFTILIIFMLSNLDDLPYLAHGIQKPILKLRKF